MVNRPNQNYIVKYIFLDNVRYSEPLTIDQARRRAGRLSLTCPFVEIGYKTPNGVWMTIETINYKRSE